jgi:isopentenyl-diphosphate delta-isomerase
MDAIFANVDATQRELLAEELILTDTKDNVVGHCAKATAHLVSENLPLHRAFSVFLFDQQNRLLLQQRSAAKVTFPLLWTNTCCSHPLFNSVECNLSDPVTGVKLAALRKLEQELGIFGLKTEDLVYLTRIQYRAVCRSSPAWGEHEIDYILLVRKAIAPDDSSAVGLKIQPNLNEVAAVKTVSLDELLEILHTRPETLTPWFHLIARKLLPDWWRNLDAALAQSHPYFDPIRIHHLRHDPSEAENDQKGDNR